MVLEPEVGHPGILVPRREPKDGVQPLEGGTTLEGGDGYPGGDEPSLRHVPNSLELRARCSRNDATPSAKSRWRRLSIVAL